MGIIWSVCRIYLLLLFSVTNVCSHVVVTLFVFFGVFVILYVVINTKYSNSMRILLHFSGLAGTMFIYLSYVYLLIAPCQNESFLHHVYHSRMQKN